MSTLKADTIQNTSGGAATLTKQHAAKAWVNFDGTASGATARDSFNLSSMTDNGAGDYSVTISNAVSNANYAASGAAGYANTNQFCMNVPESDYSPTTTVLRVQTPYANTTLGDCSFVAPHIHGDLA